MILISHIIVAIGSLIYTAYVFFNPSKNKLMVSYALTAFTFITGGYLLATEPGHITQTCITGVTYLGFMFIGILAAQRKLARKTSF
jgi:predicted tellurium resistance membrane protein TerC